MNIVKIVALFLAWTLWSCGGGSTSQAPLKNINKTHPNDPFVQTMPESQFFTIDQRKDNVVRGKGGVLVVFPQGSLLDENGKPVQGNVQIELVEALELADMVAANLTTMSDGKPLETGGMFYLNARTADGKQLRVDPKNPIYIEVPTADYRPDMQIYTGERDSLGRINWVNPVPIVSYLTMVPLELLDFLPPTFAQTVEENMPFRHHKNADKKLIDSLYFSMAAHPGYYPNFRRALHQTNVHEDFLEPIVETRNGQTVTTWVIQKQTLINQSPTQHSNASLFCGINPASIKTLKDKQFQNTLIATREFEQRLRAIFAICKGNPYARTQQYPSDSTIPSSSDIDIQAILDIYIFNTHRNLWELDSMAMDLLKTGGQCTSGDCLTFRGFAQQRLGNVRNAPKTGHVLSGHYAEKLQQNQNRLQRAQEKLNALLDKEDKAAKELILEYKELLDERQDFRMRAYGFERTELGWTNIDAPGEIPKEYLGGTTNMELAWKTYDLDRLHAYVFIHEKRSLYALTTLDNGQSFFANSPNTPNLPVGIGGAMVQILVGYKGEEIFLGTREINTNRGDALNGAVDLRKVSKAELRETINRYDSQSIRQNRIAVDLEYQYKLYQERRRQAALEEEWQFLERCWSVAFPCCTVYEGK